MRIKKNVALSDSEFLFNPATGDSFSVNPIGQEIIKMIQEGKENQSIIDTIVEDYMIDGNTVEKDLYDFNKMLISYKLSE